MKHLLFIPVVFIAAYMSAEHTFANEIIVAPSGGDYSAIQDALDNAQPGDTISVRRGVYVEHLYIEISGSSAAAPLVLRAYPGETPVLTGNGAHNSSDPHMIYIADQSYITIQGLHVCSNRATNADGGSGIFIEGSGSYISLISNTFFQITGTHGMGITLYGTKSTPLSHLTIEGNHIFDCEPATSEALTLNGNITDFSVQHNTVEDVNNIGIDFIAGESDINPTYGVRNGICAENTVRRANSSYGGGYAAGIYIDGAQNIIIERNWIEGCDMGIEIGAENNGWNATGIFVRSNVICNNDKIGIVFGGYDSSVGRVSQCYFRNNTLYHNNRNAVSKWDFHGEWVVQFANNVVCENNLTVVDPNSDRRAIAFDNSTSSNIDFKYNLFWCDTQPENMFFTWLTGEYTGFTAYTTAVASARTSLSENPQLMNPVAKDFTLSISSPAIDAGDPAYLPIVSIKDFAGNQRLYGSAVDLGAYEFIPEPSVFIVCLFGIPALCLRRR